MREELSNIKLGSRVVYAIGAVEYNALALGSPNEGWNQGIKLASIFLNLVYLNELGVSQTVAAAPLLGVAADDQHLAAVAESAAKKTFGYVTADPQTRQDMVAAELSHVKANPRTVGWRPFVEGEDVARLKEQLATADEAIGQLNHAMALSMRPEKPAVDQFLQLLAVPAVASFVADPANREAIEKALEIGGAEKPGDPSADDLDAVAAEVETAADTAGSLAEVPEKSSDPLHGSAPDPGAASSSAQEADASLSQAQLGTAVDTNTSASIDTQAGPDADTAGSLAEVPDSSSDPSQGAAPVPGAEVQKGDPPTEA